MTFICDMSDFDPTDEYELRSRAGMSRMQILVSLTTTPATRWSEAQRRGRVAPGMDGDIVILAGDSGHAAKHFANVSCTVRGGSVVCSQ
jgi:imidazolonepropionase-like amidohydrolase